MASTGSKESAGTEMVGGLSKVKDANECNGTAHTTSMRASELQCSMTVLSSANFHSLQRQYVLNAIVLFAVREAKAETLVVVV
jgi:hypothetical protein